MIEWPVVLAVLAVLAIAAALINWEIYSYEGSHLGPRAVSWLYDRWAPGYDRDKRPSEARDAEYLAGPLVEALAAGPAAEPMVLDLAAGTGRLSLALLREPGFCGQIVAVDVSRRMLECAASKLAPYGERVALLQHPAVPLPFPDGSFDAVCCVEALEVMPNMQGPLAELARVLRPGGVLLTSRSWQTRWRRATTRSRKEFEQLLQAAGFDEIQILTWRDGQFDRVWARKPGDSAPAGPRSLEAMLRCRTCGRMWMERVPGALRCGVCNDRLPVSEQGIVLAGK